ncbi:AAC(3) family N-acetyltransferase [Gorillibacterium sp. CAU 1737]|uniref:aminoglycoside N(3)-acetyltransferase n=1 Tax=Gorillibacterium sp. CAU 1737 TaxID=3140362 RepID=UPI003260ABFD
MTIYSADTPVWTKEALKHELKATGLAEGQAVLAHVSLRKLGFVIGGPETLLRAILEIIGETGTLMMPAQTWKNLDPETGVHFDAREEWWPLLREHWPAYDKAVTPAIGMGVAAEMLRTWPGAKRSDHPARSFAAVGRLAEYLTERQELEDCFGEESPLGRLYQVGGSVLLLGVGYDKNTSLHLAETRAAYPSKHWVQEKSAVLVNGAREWITYSSLAVDDQDFVELGEAFDQATAQPVHRIGWADARLIDQRQLVDWTVAWMERHRR